MARTYAKDLVGKTYKNFKVLDYKYENGKTYLYAICPYCGAKKWIRYDRIGSGDSVSCGCQHRKFLNSTKIDLTGKKFGRLTAIRPTDERDTTDSVIWECKCDCGGSKKVSAVQLLGGDVRSCGCLRAESEIETGKRMGQYLKDTYCVEGTNVKNLTMKIRKDNTSGVKGVYWDKNKKKWAAQIRFKGKNYYLGRYDTKEEAAAIRKNAEEKMFGEFLKWYEEEWKKDKGQK